MVKEVGHRAVPRHDQGRIELHERLECECALVQPGVRQRQSRRSKRQVVHEQQVEIDRAWTIARSRPGAAELPLDLEERVQELLRREGRVHRDGGVEEPWLIEEPDRVGLANTRHRDDLDSGPLPEQLHRACQRGRAFAEVRPETDVGTRHNPSLEDDAAGFGLLNLPAALA